jgi:hypothetical protein
MQSGVEMMRGLLAPIATVCTLLTLSVTVPATCQAKEKPILNLNRLNSHPRIVRYDPEHDRLIRQESVVNAPLSDPPGGKESYSGNHLRQYRFVGKAGRGGIYDAFGEYHKKVGADPKNYKYRIR